MSIFEVAKLAGVSSSTVSRVINNHPRVAPETAQSVRKAMKTLGYTPSERRPGPKPSFRSRSGVANIAFLVLGASRSRATPAFEDLLRGVSGGASNNDLNLIFNHITELDQVPGRVFDQRVDGLLLHGAVPAGEFREQLRRFPTVWLMGNRIRPDWGDQVLPDAFEIGQMGANHLLSRGHKHLVFLNLDAGHWALRMYGHAFAATASDAEAHVHKIEQVHEKAPGYWHGYSVESVEQIVQRYLALEPRPTGIFVADDMQVAMIQPALQKHGVDLAAGGVEVISCNNEQPYLVGLHPRPAVIDIRVESIGRRGVDQLLWRLEHTDVPERIITTIEPFVVEHETAMAARA
ncbi:MAG TPA: LacI family DNA-binding transcriptional regulator [Tepidisphaeraceae bacterium]|nr:LacI family DNA-binding transcriptional regulator [Tepidisphaeraceae bacterium]